MDIASPSTTALYLNAFDKNIQVDGVIKTFDDEYWVANIVPILYPLWDSDKDKLEVFVKYKDGRTKMNKTKYTRNQRTGTYKWVLISLIYLHFQMKWMICVIVSWRNTQNIE